MFNAKYFTIDLLLYPNLKSGYDKEVIQTIKYIQKKIGEITKLTSIYYFLKSSDISNFHFQTTDELCYFNQNLIATIYFLTAKTKIENKIIANRKHKVNIFKNRWLQTTVEAPKTYITKGYALTKVYYFKDFQLGAYVQVIMQHT